MNAPEDDDIKLQRASTELPRSLKATLERSLWKRGVEGGSTRQVHHRIRERDVARIMSLIEPFQEEPQLLDPHLKEILSFIVPAYLERLSQSDDNRRPDWSPSFRYGLCRILYTLCKVRGEKVIARFLNNEPRYLEPVVKELEQAMEPGQSTRWEERYVLLLWTSLLMLAPFDISSISQDGSTADTVIGGETPLELPASVPGIVIRLLQTCMRCIESPTRARDAAGSLLARVCLRPDMQRIGLLECLVKWASAYLSRPFDDRQDTHKLLGILSFVSRLARSGGVDDLGKHLPAMYETLMHFIDEQSLAAFDLSAVAKKYIIKSLRDIVVHILSSDALSTTSETSATLESIVDFMLTSLSDRSTVIRYAASKALSIITTKLEPSLAEEIIEALLGSLREDVIWNSSSRELNAVDPSKWHGVSLTLAHLLFRRAPSVRQIPDILSALILSLSFQQRSATGASIGTNVRDAACFGVWSLSRRYKTNELASVDTSTLRVVKVEESKMPIIQILALELFVTACLDPVGNIRRGASAALQELIGRHPDTVIDGISLIQIVDYHAVGLRERAIVEVAVNASQLHYHYWAAAYGGLLGWRGVGSPDVQSRLFTAAAVARLGSSQTLEELISMIERIESVLQSLSIGTAEERHGLMIAMAALVERSISYAHLLTEKAENLPCREQSIACFMRLLKKWEMIDDVSISKERDTTVSAVRPELSAAAFLTLLDAFAKLSLAFNDPSLGLSHSPSSHAIETFIDYLSRTEETVLDIIPKAARSIFLLLSDVKRASLVDHIIMNVERNIQQSSARTAGHVLALGASFGAFLHDSSRQSRIVQALSFRCISGPSVEARVVALRSISSVIGTVGTCRCLQTVKAMMYSALDSSINDYTTNEQGDVGSLLRLESLSIMETVDRERLFENTSEESKLHAAVVRLSVEKLDKVRLQAARRVVSLYNSHLSQNVIEKHGVSSYEYFAEALSPLTESMNHWKRTAVLEGIIMSAGIGSESLVQASRAALVDTLYRCDENDLFDICNGIFDILEASLDIDRVLMPLLEVLAFLFDMQVLRPVIPVFQKWRKLLFYIQKAHFKSNNVAKLVSVVHVYRGLAGISAIRDAVVGKLVSMLLHPYPKIRTVVAENLFVITSDEALLRHDWTSSPADLRLLVAALKEQYVQ